MRVLAIDTALEACAAAVLDTENGKVTSESLPMVRGHAEALMPLIEPRHEAGRHGVLGARPHRGHHRSRQLHRAARRHRGGARHRARRRQARGRPDHARGLRRAAHRPRRQDRGRGRDRCAPSARLSADVRPGRAHADRAAHRQRRRRGARRRPAARCGSSAPAPPCWRLAWPAREAPPVLVDEPARRTSSGSARLAVAADDSTSEPKPLYLRAPDAQPQDAARLPRR